MINNNENSPTEGNCSWGDFQIPNNLKSSVVINRSAIILEDIVGWLCGIGSTRINLPNKGVHTGWANLDSINLSINNNYWKGLPKIFPKQDFFGLFEDIIWVSKETNPCFIISTFYTIFLRSLILFENTNFKFSGVSTCNRNIQHIHVYNSSVLSKLESTPHHGVACWLI